MTRWIQTRPAALAALTLAALILAPPPPAAASVFLVTTTDDTLDGACDVHCSLREAVAAANASPGLDVIPLEPGLYRLTREGADEDANQSGDLDVTDDLVILGSGAGQTFLHGAQLDRVIHVAPGARLEAQSLGVQGGEAPGAGGGILNEGELSLTRVLVSSNDAVGSGGGIHSAPRAVLEMAQSAVTDNQSTDPGAGIFGGREGTMRLTNVTISTNRSQADFGGGVFAGADLDATLRNVTIVHNRAVRRGGGIHGEGTALINSQGARFANSILASNAAAEDADCSGHVGSLGWNLLGIGAGCASFGPAKNDLVGTAAAPLDPLLGLPVLEGPTPVRPPLAGSPALDAGNPAPVGSAAAACAPVDQRGEPRPGGPRCDIGAYEQTATCADGRVQLCLNGKRFRVTARWVDPDGSVGKGQAVKLTSDSGYFWFFNPDNVEVILKVHDACTFNDHYWVFLSGLTNLGVELTVEDTETGVSKTYSSPLNRAFQPVLDTEALAVCD